MFYSLEILYFPWLSYTKNLYHKAPLLSNAESFAFMSVQPSPDSQDFLETQAKKKDGKGSIPIVLFVMFCDLLGFGVVIPMFPYIAKLYALPAWLSALMDQFKMNTQSYALVIGLMAFSFNFFQFLAAPFWGKISDRYGRKPVLTISMAGYTLSWAFFAFSPSLTVLLLSRVLAGLAAANIPIAQAYIADLYPPEKRSKGMGLVGATVGLGFTFGPMLTALCLEVGNTLQTTPYVQHNGQSYSYLAIHLPIYISASLSFLAFLLALFWLPESRPKNSYKKSQTLPPQDKQTSPKSLLPLFNKPFLAYLLGSFFLFVFGFAILESLFSLFNEEVLELSPNTNALVFSFIGFTLVLVQAILIPHLTALFGSWKLTFFGFLITGLSLGSLGFVDSLGLLIGLSFLMALGNGIALPSLLSLFSQHASADEQGKKLGLAQSSSALGRIFGPFLGMILWSYCGAKLTFAAGGILAFLALLPLWKGFMMKPKENQKAIKA